MRILMVSDTYFPRVSGVASSIRSFRAGLARMGHEAHLLIPDYGAGDSVEPGIFQVSSRRIPFYPEERLMTLSGCLRIATHLASRRYDVIHIQTPFMAHFWGRYLARRWGIPAVLSYHTYFEAYVGHYYPWIPNALARYGIRGLSRIQCQIVKYGHVIEGWIGVAGQTLTPALARALKLPRSTHGVVVAAIYKNGPAAKAGIRPGDVLYAINGRPLRSANRALLTIADTKPGTPVTLGVLRAGRRLTVHAIVATRPPLKAPVSYDRSPAPPP